MPINIGGNIGDIRVGNGTGADPVTEVWVNGAVTWQRQTPFNPDTVITWSPAFVDQVMNFNQTGTDANGETGMRLVTIDTTSLANINSTEQAEGIDVNNDGDLLDDITRTRTRYSASVTIGAPITNTHIVLGDWTVSNDIDPEFVFADLTITQIAQLPEEGLSAGSNVSTYFNVSPDGTLTLTDELTENPTNADRQVNINITWTGIIPDNHNNAGQQGTVTGDIIATQDVQDAFAQWVRTTTGTPMGGTLDESEDGTPGEWMGATGVNDIMFDSGGTPTSASCGFTNETCVVFRNIPVTDTFINGERDDIYTCTLVQNGEGAQTCAPSGPVSTTGTVPDTVTIEDVLVASYTQVRIRTETRNVPNDAHAPQGEFELGDLNVSCSGNIDGDGASAAEIQALLTGDFPGTFTYSGAAIGANPSFTNERTVDINFLWTGTIPDGFIDEGAEISFTGTVQCIQDVRPVQSPMFNANSATVTTDNEGTQTAGNGDIINIGGGQDYVVTAPTGTGGTVVTGTSGFGAGTFEAPTGRGRSHTFQITNTAGTATYSFGVTNVF